METLTDPREQRLLLAESNSENLRNNEYPGRVIIVGLNDAGTHLVQAYAIMGRSPGSRNRIFVFDDAD